MNKDVLFIVRKANVNDALVAMRTQLGLPEENVRDIRKTVEAVLRTNDSLEIKVLGDFKVGKVKLAISTIDALDTTAGESEPALSAGQKHKPKKLSSEPPALAEFLIALLASPKQKDALLGDLQESFSTAIDEGWSSGRAQRMYWAETLRSIGPLTFATLKRIGVLALLISAAKKLFS